MMKQTVLVAVLGALILTTGVAQSHWGPYHYLTFETDGEVQTIKVDGGKWECLTKHKYNLHWSEKFIKCSD